MNNNPNDGHDNKRNSEGKKRVIGILPTANLPKLSKPTKSLYDKKKAKVIGHIPGVTIPKSEKEKNKVVSTQPKQSTVKPEPAFSIKPVTTRKPHDLSKVNLPFIKAEQKKKLLEIQTQREAVVQQKQNRSDKQKAFKIFIGNLGPEVNEAIISEAFSKYASLVEPTVVRDRKSGKSKGFGFVSFVEGRDFLDALKEMNNRYVGSRPVKLTKSKER